MIRRFHVCVFCGARTGNTPAHAESARALGRRIGERGLALVYGGARVGLMGALADAALAAGAPVIGVLPRSLSSVEIAHPGLTELVLVDGLHARKARMTAESDAFVALPGGFGTLDELFEALTLVQTRKVTRFPVILFGTEYWSGLIEWVRTTLASTGTINAADLDLITVTDDIGEVMAVIQAEDAARRAGDGGGGMQHVPVEQGPLEA
jgi:uncharacterized protein (TIGR00730 family)